MYSSTGVLILNYLKEGGKWKKEGWAYKSKRPLKKVKNTVLELSRSATQIKDVSNNNRSNKEDNTDVIDNKLTTVPRKQW